MKLALRKMSNLLARSIPKPVLRYALKSVSYQAELQDSLRMHVKPYTYDSAIPTRFDLNLEQLKQKRVLPGFSLHESKILALVDRLSVYASELKDVPLEKTGGAEFWFNNSSYQDGDAASLYCMIRHFKPRRIIEVGCGFSSRVMSIAARKNASEGSPIHCQFIEPYPTERMLMDRLAGPLLEKKVQDVSLDVFQELDSGDMLFIDTSHVLKTQNDCCYEYLQVVPSLKPGVLIHVHDIFTPYDYPAEWILHNQFAFNEQYALECLLSGNPRTEVLLPLYWLYKDHPEHAAKIFRSSSIRSAAFWFRFNALSSTAPGSVP
jgi:predicted O-methyltransferase YrrM